MKIYEINRYKFYLNILILALFVFGFGLLNELFGQTLTQFHINGPANSVSFGRNVAVLPNGNFVVTDPDFSVPGGTQFIGAVYLYNGNNGNLISTLKGGTANDRIGLGGIEVLANGNYVIKSPDWNNGGITKAGATTFGHRNTGVSGVVSSANSVVGSTANDSTGLAVFPLANGNYVVANPYWDNGSIVNAGAVTLGRGDIGTSGVISQTNSLVGTTADDRVGFGSDGVTPLPGGNFVVLTDDWDDASLGEIGAATFWKGNIPTSGVITSANSLVGITAGTNSTSSITVLTNGNYVVSNMSTSVNGINGAGSATFGNGTNGVSGAVSSSKSLVGSTASDFVGRNIVPLSNGNYVILNYTWDNGAVVNAGAATFANGTTGINGVVSAANSLVGTQANDEVGRSAAALTNGNYVVNSYNWDNGTRANAGAATFGNGNTGVTGTISTANSLIGLNAGNQVGIGGTTALANGNYVVNSYLWDNGSTLDVGAVTFGNGTTGITGNIAVSNSLIGSTASDEVGTSSTNGVIALTNGNFVVLSRNWDNGAVSNAGAATFGSGTTGISGTISPANSLVGTSANDFSNATVESLTNGNYAVAIQNWDNGAISNAGAVTFGNGTSGISGNVSTANSLFGSKSSDRIGADVTALPNGNYLIESEFWDNGAATDAGAITVGNGTTGITGAVSPSNSLVGSQADDFDFPFCDSSTGYQLCSLDDWDNGAITDAGAVTFFGGQNPPTGTVNSSNSVLGTTPGGGNSIQADLDETNNQFVVGRSADNIVTVARINNHQTADFDYDGDGKSDISVFRPSNGAWYLQQSTNGFTGITFGQNGDLITPADFDGDGKTDIAVFRPSDGGWYYLKSSDNSFVGTIFGQNGDVPRPGDFDGDGKADINVFRPSDGGWYRLNSSNGMFVGAIFGQNGDKPLIADYDGDGKSDVAVYRPLTAAFYWLDSSTGAFKASVFGFSTDIPTPADFDGDGKTDIAVFRPSDGGWYRYNSSTGAFYGTLFGQNGDIPTVGDYDGDGKADIAVFRSGNWYYLNSSNGGFVGAAFGFSTDTPTPAAFAQ